MPEVAHDGRRVDVEVELVGDQTRAEILCSDVCSKTDVSLIRNLAIVTFRSYSKNICRFETIKVNSVTRWQGYCFDIWPFAILNFCPIPYFLPKYVKKFFKYKIKSQKSPKTFIISPKW